MQKTAAEMVSDEYCCSSYRPWVQLDLPEEEGEEDWNEEEEDSEEDENKKVVDTSGIKFKDGAFERVSYLI